jgi:esterase/lipase superfamily enzyme
VGVVTQRQKISEIPGLNCCTSLNGAASITDVTNNIIDLNTPVGAIEWMKGLPTENLLAIAARPIDQFNYLLVCAADGELILRGVK